MKESVLKKIFIGVVGIFALCFTQKAFSQVAAPCLETCLNTGQEFFTCCVSRDNPNGTPCSVEQYCHDFCACGNGALDTVCDVVEECDDGNGQAGDGCDQSCRNECGNGILDGNEQCDDGNRESGDGCDSNCRTEQRVPVTDVADTPPILFKGQLFYNPGAELLDLGNREFNIRPNGPTVLVVKGVSYGDPSISGKLSVMGKQAVANEAARIRQAIINGTIFTGGGTNTVAYADYPGCYKSKNVQWFPGQFGKGCKETPMTRWMDIDLCPASAGCCIQPVEGSNPPVPKALTDPTLDRNYQCTVAPGSANATPGSTDTVRGNGIY